MAVPKRKQSKSRRGKRRSHDAIRPKELVECKQCQRFIPSHTICPGCGAYMGRPVMAGEGREV